MPLHYVEITDDNTDEYIGLFRIIPANTRKLATINEVQYSLEHVLSTLLNDVLFKYHQRTNFTTRDNIEYVLSQQTTKHWRLGICDITRYFHYKWENENGLLGPLFSIAEPFDVPYVWTWDTQSYPWTINLVTPSESPTAEIRFGKNLAEIERTVDPSNIVNRLYALGAGEGVNQLDITRVNNGRAYIENAASIAQYGLGQYVWVDRRFEDEASLLASAQAFLDEWSLPRVSYNVKAVDLSSLTGLSIDEFTVGKVVRVVDPEIGTFTARIVSEKKADIYGAPGDIDIGLANTKDNVGTTLADVERRQEINEVYSQGATNMLIYPYEDNADSDHPATIRFKLPSEMVRINKLELTYETSEFRAYSRAIEGGGSIATSTAAGGAVVKSTSSGGGTTATSSSGGGTTATSSSGGGTSTSTQSGGGSSQTSAAGGNHTHKMFTTVGYDSDDSPNTSVLAGANSSLGGSVLRLPGNNPGNVEFYTQGASGTHSHSVSIPAHSHNFSTPNHSHSVTIPSHVHDVSIPNHVHNIDIPSHTHDISIPNHTHAIDHGIFKLNRTPSQVTIIVDGNSVPISSTRGDSIDLIPYLSLDSENRVQRGWHTVEITPNDLGRINAQLMVQFFMQSRGGVDA